MEPRLETSEAIFLLPLYALMPWTGKSLLLLQAFYCRHFTRVLTFVFTCITSAVTVGNQQFATFYLFTLISSTCFGRCFRPSSGAYHCNYRFCYCPPMLLCLRASLVQLQLITNKMQLFFYLFTLISSTCFGRCFHPKYVELIKVNK